MPCFCWISEDQIAPNLLKIRKHMQVIVNELNYIRSQGDIVGNGPIPKDMLKDTHELLDHLYTGECPEKPKE